MILRYIVQNTSSGFTITYYNKDKHPSDFKYKIIVKEYEGMDGKWEKYKGEFLVNRAYEENGYVGDGMIQYYNKPKEGKSALEDIWSFPCTVKRVMDYDLREKEKYIYPKIDIEMYYTYNVWYNGVGRGFTISEDRVDADRSYMDHWE